MLMVLSHAALPAARMICMQRGVLGPLLAALRAPDLDNLLDHLIRSRTQVPSRMDAACPASETDPHCDPQCDPALAATDTARVDVMQCGS